MGYRHSAETIELAYRKRLEGLTFQQIADYLTPLLCHRFTKESVISMMRRNHPELVGKQVRYDPKLIADVHRVRNDEGITSYTEIARLLGIRRTQVHNILYNHRPPIKGPERRKATAELRTVAKENPDLCGTPGCRGPRAKPYKHCVECRERIMPVRRRADMYEIGGRTDYATVLAGAD